MFGKWFIYTQVSRKHLVAWIALLYTLVNIQLVNILA